MRALAAKSVSLFASLYVLLVLIGPTLPYSARIDDFVLIVALGALIVSGSAKWHLPRFLAFVLAFWAVIPFLSLAKGDEALYARETMRVIKMVALLLLFSNLHGFTFAKVLCGAAVAIFVVQLAQMWSDWFPKMGDWYGFDAYDRNRPPGPFRNPNLTGSAYLAFLIIATVMLGKPKPTNGWWWAAGIAAASVGVVLTHSRTAVGILVICGALSVLLARGLPYRWQVWALVGVLVVLTSTAVGLPWRMLDVLGGNDASFQEHRHQASHALQLSTETTSEILFGNGQVPGVNPDFEYGHLFMWYGLTGPVALFLLVAAFFHVGLRIRGPARVMVLLMGMALPLMAVTGSAVISNRTFPLWMVALGLGLADIQAIRLLASPSQYTHADDAARSAPARTTSHRGS